MNRAVLSACAVSLGLGLFFIFIWAPHPWGWAGIDQYDDLARTLAAGRPFPTLEVPWGYAYFVAAFYRLFGTRLWVPLVAQALLNATIPALTFVFARTWLDARTATAAAVLTGLLSFNTVYVSTEASDSVCTWLFMTALVAFARGRERDDWRWLGLAGLLSGAASQFRPNLLPIPLLLAALLVLQRRTRRALASAVLIVAAATAVIAPWVVRNYRLTRTVLPTSVHGGVQLWYGTLQVGPYLTSRAYNPRAVFETPSFDYTSLLDVPIVVDADVQPCLPARAERTTLVYWTDHHPVRTSITQTTSAQPFSAELPAPRQPTALYYYFESDCRVDGAAIVRQVPRLGAAAPLVFFASADHLGDLDVHHDLLDVFDVIRLARHAAWNEPLPARDALAAGGIVDVATAIEALTPVPPSGPTREPPPQLRTDERETAIAFSDGSSIVIPRRWSERITDVAFDGLRAQSLLHANASIAELAAARASGRPPTGHAREEQPDISVNRVFYRREPHLMRRYSALAFDNIGRDPIGFALASAYRAVRLFVIAGTTDPHTAQQFERSRLVYAAGAIASAIYLVLFVGGVVVAYRQGDALWLPLMLVLYVPATIAPVLTNMRYTITVQPLVFMFVAVALSSLVVSGFSRTRWSVRLKADTTAWSNRSSGRSADPAAPDREETRTARQP